MSMDKDTFWQIIDEVNSEVSRTDLDGIIEATKRKLCFEYSQQEIAVWSNYQQYYRDLADTSGLFAASCCLNDCMSDDGFNDFRMWLISQGKEAYLSALKNPDSLAGLGTPKNTTRFEPYGFVAYDAYDLWDMHGDVYEEKDRNPLTEAQKAEIRAEIEYYPHRVTMENAESHLPNLRAKYLQPWQSILLVDYQPRVTPPPDAQIPVTGLDRLKNAARLIEDMTGCRWASSSGGAFIYPESNRQGESYLRIAGAMSELGVRYHEAAPEWNKHMVKRMLENPKYAGQEPYPAIVSVEAWRDAQVVRDRKTAGYISQSPCVELLKRGMVCGECGAAFSRHTPTNATGNRWWHCSNPECSCTLKIRDDTLEETVTALLNRLVTEPELLDPREPGEHPLSLEAARMQNEINRELGKMEINEEYLTALIFGCAAEKYEMLDSGEAQRKTARLKAELRERPLLTAFDASLFSETTETLLVSADGTLALRLYSGGDITETGKEREPYAGNNNN